MILTANRYHDFSCGHRVYGHEGKCANLHGHNYRVHFHVRTDVLDTIGRVVDFSVIKERLCDWVEKAWDHRFLIWHEDPWSQLLTNIDPHVVVVSFNPTAENMASFLLNTVGPLRLNGTGVELSSILIEETRKCSVQIWNKWTTK